MNEMKQQPEDDRLKFGWEILDKFLRPFSLELSKAVVDHKVSVLRDYSTISSVILAGLGIFVLDKKIQTPWLFYAGISSFIGLLIFNFVLLRFYLNEEVKLLNAYDKAQKDILEAMRRYAFDRTEENAKELSETMGAGVNVSKTQTFIQRNGDSILFTVFITALLSTFCGLIIEVKVQQICGLFAG